MRLVCLVIGNDNFAPRVLFGSLIFAFWKLLRSPFPVLSLTLRFDYKRIKIPRSRRVPFLSLGFFYFFICFSFPTATNTDQDKTHQVHEKMTPLMADFLRVEVGKLQP